MSYIASLKGVMSAVRSGVSRCWRPGDRIQDGGGSSDGCGRKGQGDVSDTHLG